MIEIIKSAFRNIFRKRLRSFLTISGIAIGVLSVIIISAIGETGKYTIYMEMENIGIGGLAVSANKNVSGAVIGSDELATIQNAETVSEATPLVVEYTDIGVRNFTMNCLVWGVDSNVESIVSMDLLYGRLINQSDIQGNLQTCVVDENFAMGTYKRSNIVGKTIHLLLNGEYEPFEVVGVVASGGNLLQNLMGDFIPNFVYIPITTAQEYCGKQEYDQILVNLSEEADSVAAVKSLNTALERQNGLQNSIRIENMVNQKEKLDGILDIVTWLLTAIAAISLIVAGLSIMTVMLVSVHERTREIGIKKSIGATRSAILREFMVESFLISLIGSGIGTAIGVGISFAGCLILDLPFIFRIQTAGICILFAVAIGCLFGVYPAKQAAKMSPVEALRCD